MGVAVTRSKIVVRTADFILNHGNGVRNPEQKLEIVHTVHNATGDVPKPIVKNKDARLGLDVHLGGVMRATIL